MYDHNIFEVCRIIYYAGGGGGDGGSGVELITRNARGSVYVHTVWYNIMGDDNGDGDVDDDATAALLVYIHTSIIIHVIWYVR